MRNAPPLDLLREKRQELGLPEPEATTAQSRRLLLRGVGIGAALIGGALGLAVLVLLRSMLVSAAVDRLTAVQAEFQMYESQLSSARSRLKGVIKANQELVQGVVAVRSGSAVLRDLQSRVPEGIQLIQATEEPNGYRFKGVASDPGAFARINALQLLLKRSPLADPNAVTLVKGCRIKVGKEVLECLKSGQKADEKKTSQWEWSSDVAFEMVLAFRPGISPAAERQILRELDADGLVRRLDLLQQEGLY